MLRPYSSPRSQALHLAVTSCFVSHCVFVLEDFELENPVYLLELHCNDKILGVCKAIIKRELVICHSSLTGTCDTGVHCDSLLNKNKRMFEKLSQYIDIWLILTLNVELTTKC